MITRALLVTSSILGDNGQSNALATHFQQQAAARDGVAVTHRDVVANALPHLAIEELGAWQTPADERTTEQQALAAHSDELLAERASPGGADVQPGHSLPAESVV